MLQKQEKSEIAIPKPKEENKIEINSKVETDKSKNCESELNKFIFLEETVQVKFNKWESTLTIQKDKFNKICQSVLQYEQMYVEAKGRIIQIKKLLTELEQKANETSNNMEELNKKKEFLINSFNNEIQAMESMINEFKMKTRKQQNSKSSYLSNDKNDLSNLYELLVKNRNIIENQIKQILPSIEQRIISQYSSDFSDLAKDSTDDNMKFITSNLNTFVNHAKTVNSLMDKNKSFYNKADDMIKALMKRKSIQPLQYHS